MSEVDDDPERRTLAKVLAQSVRTLAEGDVLMIAELDAAGVIRWEVWRDECGTPRARKWPTQTWPDLCDAEAPSPGTLSADALSRVTRPPDGCGMLLVCTAPEDPYAGQALAQTSPDVQSFRCAIPLADALRVALAEDPLKQRYELVALDVAADDRLELGTIGLFSQKARRGDRESLRVRCAPSGDDEETVFAVVACEVPLEYRLLSIQSALLPRGVHRLTAELVRPGVVRFLGLSSPPRKDNRSWAELMAGIPERLDRLGPAHLIVAIETSGTSEHVRERIDRADQLIRNLARHRDAPLRCSLLSYGPHAVHRNDPEVPVTILAWVESSEAVLAELAELSGQEPAPVGYWRAAQLECLLTQLARRLSDDDGRPVLVSIGSRPAFPHEQGRESGIVPCPSRHDWRRALMQLREHPGIAFGAIRDHGTDEEIWSHLGGSAFSRRTFEWRRFAVDLGLLRETAQSIQFPLIEPEGA